MTNAEFYELTKRAATDPEAMVLWQEEKFHRQFEAEQRQRKADQEERKKEEERKKKDRLLLMAMVPVACLGAVIIGLGIAWGFVNLLEWLFS